MTIDPRGKFLYVSNFNANTVGAYQLDPATGAPSGTLGSGGVKVGTGPTCLSIEPALGIYLYTSNLQSSSISGQQLNPSTGALQTIQNSPFDAGSQLSCAASAANGTHATSLVTP